MCVCVRRLNVYSGRQSTPLGERILWAHFRRGLLTQETGHGRYLKNINWSSWLLFLPTHVLDREVERTLCLLCVYTVYIYKKFFCRANFVRV